MAMRREALITSLFVSIAAGVFALEPGYARAYCASPVVSVGVTDAFPGLEIPVWVSTGSNSSVEILDHSQAEFARVVLEVIARHNEAVAAPKLYFAGFTNKALAPKTLAYTGWDAGIVVHSFGCDLLTDPDFESDELCAADQESKKACTKHYNIPSINGLTLVASVNLIPPKCEHSVYKSMWSIDGSSSDDIAEVLLHEFGHALGLRHSDVTRQDCVVHGHLHGNDDGPNFGTMWPVTSGSLGLYRHWRRDDLDGLARLYGAFYPELEFAYWTDHSFPGAPEIEGAQSLAGFPVARTPALGDAPPGQAQPVALVDPTRRVQFARLAGDGGVVEAPTVIDGGPLGRAWIAA